MDRNDESGERVARFFSLYEEEVKSALDIAEFDADDLYAFQALERALRSDNQELRNLAVHLQTQRQERLESIVVDSTERMRTTQRIKVMSWRQAPKELTAQSAEPPSESSAPVIVVSDGMVKPAAVPEPALEAAAGDAEAVPPPTQAPAQTERRSGAARLNPQELSQVSNLQRLFREEFSYTLDVARFTLDDDYGRSIIEESLTASSQELVELTRYYLDDQGRSRIHRRFNGTVARG